MVLCYVSYVEDLVSGCASDVSAMMFGVYSHMGNRSGDENVKDGVLHILCDGPVPELEHRFDNTYYVERNYFAREFGCFHG